MSIKYLYSISIYLPLAIALFVLGSHVLKKMMRPAVVDDFGVINVIAKLPVGNKEQLLLVDINNTKILLGMTQNNISNLLMLDKNLVPYNKVNNISAVNLAKNLSTTI